MNNFLLYCSLLFFKSEMLDQISFHYKTKRTNFGRPTSIFEDTNTRMIMSVEPEQELREKYEAINPFSVGVQASVTYSSHSVNTEVTQTKVEDIIHKEGGWPQGIDPTNAPSCKQTRSKLEKKDNFLPTLRELSQEVEKTVKLNVSIDLFKDHFQATEEKPPISDPSMRTLSIFRDKFENRSVSSISWSSESASSQTKRVAIGYTPKDLSCPTAHYESFIYNLECPSLPEYELHPPSPLICLEYNTKDSNFLVGGMSHGSLSLWDIRQGSLPVWTSAIESSHRGAVNAVRWISSKTAFECVSVSADGNAMMWDTRSNTSPLEVIQLAPAPEALPEGFTPPFGGKCLDYHTGVPTKYMVGTVEGLVMSVNRKASDPSTRISNVFPGHYGPVYAVRRHPTETKYFCSISDWSCRFFTEDNKTPLITIPAQRNYLTNAVWGLSRTTVIYTGNTVGGIDAWDLIQSLKQPVCSISVGSNPVYSMAIENNGQFLLTGDSEGTATLLELNDPLRNITQTEKSLFNGMMGRESKRVKNYDQFIKEQKMREKQKAGGHMEEGEKKEEKPFNPEEIEQEFEAALKGEMEKVVEKKRVVIGEEDEQQPQPPQGGDGKLANVMGGLANGLLPGEGEGEEEEGNTGAEEAEGENNEEEAEGDSQKSDVKTKGAKDKPAKIDSNLMKDAIKGNEEEENKEGGGEEENNGEGGEEDKKEEGGEEDKNEGGDGESGKLNTDQLKAMLGNTEENKEGGEEEEAKDKEAGENGEEAPEVKKIDGDLMKDALQQDGDENQSESKDAGEGEAESKDEGGEENNEEGEAESKEEGGDENKEEGGEENNEEGLAEIPNKIGGDLMKDALQQDGEENQSESKGEGEGEADDNDEGKEEQKDEDGKEEQKDEDGKEEPKGDDGGALEGISKNLAGGLMG